MKPMPTINVNLTRICQDCVALAPGPHDSRCVSAEGIRLRPALIPCPLDPFRSVGFTMRLGECSCTIPSWWTQAAKAHADADRTSGRVWSCACGPCAAARRNGWIPDQHNATCPARLVRVACSIGGDGTWAGSEVTDVEVPDVLKRAALVVCRARWAIVKAVVLGHQDISSLLTGPMAAALLAQRDAEFSALADMVRHERGALEAQRRAEKAFPYHRFHRVGAGSHEGPRPSTARLAAYVEYVIEEVGKLP